MPSALNRIEPEPGAAQLPAGVAHLEPGSALSVVVVGAGPVGVRFCHEILQRRPYARVTLIGNESSLPYNRVQLSALLAGDVRYESILTALPSGERHPLFRHVNATIAEIDTDAHVVVDIRGNRYPYGKLVLATGSRAHVPNVPGVEQSGVYTFRNLKDTEALRARLARARHVVVVGGGLLGLEAARALQRGRTQVTVVQQGTRLMNRQLDEAGAALLQAKVESLGIRVITRSGVRGILGDGRVHGVVTRDGEQVICDTVLLCTGIKPNIELALAARLKVSTGILVDDRLATSDADVLAIGECCEHRGVTYGLVNPGFEQAAVAADVIAGGQACYLGSLEVSRLKVVGESVCSMGEVAELLARTGQRLRVWRGDNGVYRKLIVHRGRLIGAAAIGEWSEARRVQEAYQSQRRLRLWEQWRFVLTGSLWSDTEDAVSLWPEAAVVCQCKQITRGQLGAAMAAGCATVVCLSERTGAGTVCGSCKPLLQSLVGDSGQREREKGAFPLLWSSALAALLAVVAVAMPGLSVADSVQQQGIFEHIWNDGFWKQVTGFSLLGLSLLGLAMSLRKRIPALRLGDFGNWRLLHAVLGLLCAVLLLVHTGMHLGENLNRLLAMNFIAVLVMGALTGVVVAQSHRLRAAAALRLRKLWTWAHVLCSWPLPLLLSVHVLTVYYF